MPWLPYYLARSLAYGGEYDLDRGKLRGLPRPGTRYLRRPGACTVLRPETSDDPAAGCLDPTRRTGRSDGTEHPTRAASGWERHLRWIGNLRRLSRRHSEGIFEKPAS